MKIGFNQPVPNRMSFKDRWKVEGPSGKALFSAFAASGFLDDAYVGISSINKNVHYVYDGSDLEKAPPGTFITNTTELNDYVDHANYYKYNMEPPPESGLLKHGDWVHFSDGKAAKS